MSNVEDKRLEQARKEYEIYKNINDVFHCEALERIFPELKESNDERIRKEIVSAINIYCSEYHRGTKVRNNMLAWLEKQGEKKPEVKYVYTKFRIGDVIVEIKPNGYCPPVTVKYVGEGSYSCESDDGKRFLSFPIIRQDEYKLVKQVSVWSEEDEKKLRVVVDYLIADNGLTLKHINWLKSIKDRVQPKQEWNGTEIAPPIDSDVCG